MDLYLDYDESREGGEADDPSDEWTSHQEEYIHFYPRGIYLDKKAADKVWVTWIEATDHFSPFEEGYLVVVRYRTGNTFGSTNGAWYIEGFYREKEKAEGIKKAIEKGKYPGYAPWIGHFESLQYVEIKELVVL